MSALCQKRTFWLPFDMINDVRWKKLKLAGHRHDASPSQILTVGGQYCRAFGHFADRDCASVSVAPGALDRAVYTWRHD
jgi:hypothetical protein